MSPFRAYHIISLGLAFAIGAVAGILLCASTTWMI
jgi:hypothetical protein